MDSTYLQRAATFEVEAQKLGRQYNQYALLRLLFFILAIGIAIYLFSSVSVWLGAGFVVAFLYGFYRFIVWHQKIQQKQRHYQHLAKLNSWEENGQNHDYSVYHDGANFMDTDHPYAVDLDIFGPYSLFQYINRATTALGREMLADWLATSHSREDINVRQSVIPEMSKKLEWRQHFQAYGLEAEDQMEYVNLLREWLEKPPYISNNKGVVAALYLIPLWSVVVCVLWALYLPWYIALLLFLPSFLLLRQFVERINQTHIQTTHAEKALAHYAKLIEHIERGEFSNEQLKAWQREFKGEDQSASTAIKQLSYIISQLNVRYNAFAILLNILGVWDLQWVYRLERWKERMKPKLPNWFHVMAKFEAISSFANLYYNNPEWCIPEIQDSKPLIDAEALGHPLIHKDKRVCNDVQLPTLKHLKLITGSNMAGKSTFLRTVGMNIVLAMAGAPVCAKRMAVPPLRVYTSMRTQDALHESTSSFFAELKRLKFIIAAVEEAAHKGPPAVEPYFLLDEILKGTNSRDRHTGSKALIRQLTKYGAGIIATHDLELGQLEQDAGGTIENLRIEVEIKEGQLHFDYKLKKGVSESFNATLLMKQMGIKIDDEYME
jgi:DNA mismatch repair ATPase MutS